MSAAQFDFVKGCNGDPLEVGATFSYQLVWESETCINGEVTYAPMNLTGYSAKMQVRERPGSPVILELSTANERITFDPTNGIINLVVPATETTCLKGGLYRYDLDLTDPNGFVTRFIQGAFEISAAITE